MIVLPSNDTTIDIYVNINEKRISEWRSSNSKDTELNIYTSFNDAHDLLLSVLQNIYEPCSSIFSKYRGPDEISLPSDFVKKLTDMGIMGEENQLELYRYVRSILSSIVVNSSNCTIDTVNILIDIIQNINSAYDKEVELNKDMDNLWAKNENNYFLMTLINLIIKICKTTKTSPSKQHIKCAIYIIFKNDTHIEIDYEDDDIRIENENFEDDEDGPVLQKNSKSIEILKTFSQDEEDEEEIVREDIFIDKDIDDKDIDEDMDNDIHNEDYMDDFELFLAINQKEEEDEVYFDENNKDILEIVKIFKNNKYDVSKTFAYNITQVVEKYFRYLEEPIYINRINFFHPIGSL